MVHPVDLPNLQLRRLPDLDVPLVEEVREMARTKKGKKIVPVKPHKRKPAGGKHKSVRVRRHRRSTPN
jgi:hypothetical protein